MTSMLESEISTLCVMRELEIKAEPEAVFKAILAEVGPEGQMPDGSPFPMVLEAWPGGRWFRDLGEGRGHWWGHVQVIKPPTLLEISGPMFMSYPAVSHVQYRVSSMPGGAMLKLTHRAMGLITAEHREGVHTGWDFGLERVRQIAEMRT
ncbi:MAG: SRPBCC domain-containing protein [Phycisphaeraceae bacterium]|nr:SRPBCC domain-containing protein [Phycisphaeraceae bacterium]